MATAARVHDIDSIRRFRAAMVKFVETSNVAMTDSEGEVTRKIGWLEGEQDQFWSMQIRKWTEEVNRAKDAVRQKRIFKDAMGRTQSTVDEEKHLKKCKLILDEAETKLANTRRHAKQLQREHLMYRGGVQRLATVLASDMPNAIATLDRVVGQLERYVAAGPVMAESEVISDSTGSAGTDGDGSMRRAVEPDADVKKDEPKKEELNNSAAKDTQPVSK